MADTSSKSKRAAAGVPDGHVRVRVIYSAVNPDKAGEVIDLPDSPDLRTAVRENRLAIVDPSTPLGRDDTDTDTGDADDAAAKLAEVLGPPAQGADTSSSGETGSTTAGATGTGTTGTR